MSLHALNPSRDIPGKYDKTCTNVLFISTQMERIKQLLCLGFPRYIVAYLSTALVLWRPLRTSVPVAHNPIINFRGRSGISDPRILEAF